MKILLLSDLNSIHTKKWVKALADRGCQVAVFGLAKPIDDFYDGIKDVEVCSADFTNQYGRSSLIKIKYLKVVRKLKSFARSVQPDIVHAHYATSYGLLGTFLKHEKYAISVWGEDVFSFPKESSIKKILFKRNLKKASALFSTSEVMAKEAGLYTDKTVHVVPFGVDINRFRPIEIAEKQAGKVVFGIVKTLEAKYGISYLIAAFHQLLQRDREQSYQLIIVGKGSKEQALKEQVRSLGIESQVAFTGVVPHDQVPLYFNKMDVVVVPSVMDGESFGVAAVEASACERPVIVSNVGGLPEVVLEGKTGLICPPKDSDCLADKMVQLANDSALRKTFGKEGRKNVLEKYDWQKNADLMMQHYQKMMKN